MGRKWTADERAEQSLLTQEREIWRHSTGAKTNRGKRAVSLNSMKSGYFKEEFRAFRSENRRSPKARQIEKLVREVSKENESEKVFNIIERIEAKLEEYNEGMDQNGAPPDKVMEATYLSCLVRTIANNCLIDRITTKLADLNNEQIQDAP